jgi:hypothetical protein
MEGAMLARRIAAVMPWALMIISPGCATTGLEGDTGVDARGDSSVDEPSFDPPIENLGDPGWRDSTEPWCESGEMARRGWDIWSDSRGVFVIIDLYDPRGGSGPMYSEHLIYFNGGTGWGPYLSGPSADTDTCVTALTGIPGSDLIGWDDRSAYCQLTTFVDGEERHEGFSAFDVFAVSENLAYAIPVGDPRVIKYEGGSWGPLPGDPVPLDVHRIWGTKDVIFAAGESGIMLSNEEGRWTVHDTRTMASFQAVWGFAADDVWASTTWPALLLHYDGARWEHVDWPDPTDPDDPCDTAEIRGFWGKDGVLFFFADSTFVRWDGETFTVLGHWPRRVEATGTGHTCLGGLWISDIWGNEVDEVFLGIIDSGIYDEDCGEEFLLYWDGSEFHWF